MIGIPKCTYALNTIVPGLTLETLKRIVNKVEEYQNPQTCYHGLEYEFQLVCILKGQMRTAWVNSFDSDSLLLSISEGLLRPSSAQSSHITHITADLGNIEIATDPHPTYKQAVAEAEELLNNKVVPWLSKHLNKFALFLPAIMSCLDAYTGISCTKHWNINYCVSGHPTLYTYPWGYKPGVFGERLHIKIPYHYTPPEDIMDLPPFEDIILPPDNWRPLVGYYRNGTWIQVRKLR